MSLSGWGCKWKMILHLETSLKGRPNDDVMITNPIIIIQLITKQSFCRVDEKNCLNSSHTSTPEQQSFFIIISSSNYPIVYSAGVYSIYLGIVKVWYW